jgi:predicted phosphodiesterase
MKIAVITDAHANLPALQAALQAIRAEACDAIFHVMDAIAIGPQPAECLDLMQGRSNLTCISGNHDLYFANGLPDPQPVWMSDGEVKHQLWTHAQLGSQSKSLISRWPLVQEEIFEGVRTVFVHYGMADPGIDFMKVVQNPDGAALDGMFAQFKTELLFFGYHHVPADVEGKARYINPGSLGCCPQAAARYTIVEFAEGQAKVRHCSVPYDDRELYEAFEKRNVRERDFIYKVFLGGRFCC